MKRLPLILNVLAVAAFSASCAYWALQLYKPAQRPIAAPPPAARAAPGVASATGLFGGAQVAAVASNYQLTGVVAAGRDSVAILVADGNPPKAVRLGREVTPGVVVQEVHPRYVMLSDSGVARRVDLAQDVRPPADMQAPVAMPAPMQPAPQPAVQQETAPPEPVADTAQEAADTSGTATSEPGPLAPPPGQQSKAHEAQPAFMPQSQPPVRMPAPVPPTQPQTR